MFSFSIFRSLFRSLFRSRVRTEIAAASAARLSALATKTKKKERMCPDGRLLCTYRTTNNLAPSVRNANFHFPSDIRQTAIPSASGNIQAANA